MVRSHGKSLIFSALIVSAFTVPGCGGSDSEPAAVPPTSTVAPARTVADYRSEMLAALEAADKAETFAQGADTWRERATQYRGLATTMERNIQPPPALRQRHNTFIAPVLLRGYFVQRFLRV